jgi:hypothetical protein
MTESLVGRLVIAEGSEEGHGVPCPYGMSGRSSWDLAAQTKGFVQENREHDE